MFANNEVATISNGGGDKRHKKSDLESSINTQNSLEYSTFTSRSDSRPTAPLVPSIMINHQSSRQATQFDTNIVGASDGGNNSEGGGYVQFDTLAVATNPLSSQSSTSSVHHRFAPFAASVLAGSSGNGKTHTSPNHHSNKGTVSNLFCS